MTERDQTRSFLRDMIRTDQLQDGDDIFARGFVNSLFAMQLVAWIEKTFQLQIGDDDLDISNFNSVDAIAGFIDRKRAPASAAVRA